MREGMESRGEKATERKGEVMNRLKSIDWWLGVVVGIGVTWIILKWIGL